MLADDEKRELIDKAIAASDRVNHEELCSCDKPPEACAMYSHRPWSHDPEFVAAEVLRLAADALEEALTEPEWEEETQYGNLTAIGFLAEIRGPNYATHQRTFRVSKPVPIERGA